MSKLLNKNAFTNFEPWVGFDLDGTLAMGLEDYSDPTVIGEPVPAMVELVKRYLASGMTVKVFTARVSDKARAGEIKAAIRAWTLKHIGIELDSTCEKDPGLQEYFDDKAVGVKADTGKIAKVKFTHENLPDWRTFVKYHGGIKGLSNILNFRDYAENIADVYEDQMEGMSDEEKGEFLDEKILQQTERRYDEVTDFFFSLNFPLEVYREITVPSLDNIKFDSIGVYWTWDEDAAEAHWGQGTGYRVKFAAEINADIVDWDTSIMCNLDPSLGEDEKEIRLFDGASFEILGYEVRTSYKGRDAEWVPMQRRVTAKLSAKELIVRRANKKAKLASKKASRPVKSPVKTAAFTVVGYHGTRKKFTTFRPHFRQGMQLGFGIHFAADKDFAAGYAFGEAGGRGTDPTLYTCELTMNKPLKANEIVSEGSPEYALAEKLAKFRPFAMKNQEGVKQYYMQAAIDATGVQRAERLIREAGYDGVIYTARKMTGGGSPGTYINYGESECFVVFQPSQIRVITKEHEPEAQPKVAMPSKPPGNPDETYQEGSNGWALFEGKRTDALRNADVDKMLPMPIQAAKSDPIRDLVNYLDTPWRQKLEAFAEAFLDEWQEWVEIEEDEDPVYPTEAEDPELDHFYEMNHRIKLYEDPLACPAWMFLDYKGTNTGWVVHFTNFAEDIAKNGFTKGVPEPDQLALTREREKPGPGYNFGFEAKNKHYVREAAYDERPGNYGRQAVLCKVEYVLCHHSTDRYEQAIFWGPDAKVRIPIIPQHGEDLYELIEKALHENRKVKKKEQKAANHQA